VQAIFRDLEGVKLISPRHDALLATLKPGVARALAYDSERGWSRVAYCLFVNHLAEIAAAITDRHPDASDQLEAELWSCAHGVLAGFARDHGRPPQLRAMLAGVPLPAKANLRLRWARGADREADYLNVLNPLSEHAFAWGRGMTSPCLARLPWRATSARSASRSRPGYTSSRSASAVMMPRCPPTSTT
jgi:siderophore synthetase component